MYKNHRNWRIFNFSACLSEIFNYSKNGTFSITFLSKKDFPRFFILLIAKDMQTERKGFFSFRQKHDYTG